MMSEIDPFELTLDGLARLEVLKQTGLATSFVVGGFSAFRAGAAFSVLGFPTPPELKGQHQRIGVMYARVRGEPGRSCRVKILYPASDSSAEEAEAPYCTDGRKTSDGMASVGGFRQALLSFLLAHLADAPSGCTLEAAPAQGSFPLLVYSHGMGGNFDTATYFLRQIASFGVVVAAVEHTDGTASRTVLEGGEERLFGAWPPLSRTEELRRRASELLAASDRHQLPERLRGIVDAEAVFLGGHSYGGPAALVAAAQSAKASGLVRGLVLHDPATAMLSPDLDSAPPQPVLSLISEQYAALGVRCGQTLVCDGSFHGNFVDAPLWAPLWIMRLLSKVIPAAGPADPLIVHETAASAAAEFISAVMESNAPAEAEDQQPWHKAQQNMMKEANVAQIYPVVALHPELFAPGNVDSWFVPALRAALAEWRQTGDPSAIDLRRIPGLRLEAPGVVSFDCLEPAVCDLLMEEARHFEESDLPQHSPNSMNKYGVLLNEIGLRPSFTAALEQYLAGLAAVFFGDDDVRPAFMDGREAELENWGGATVSEHYTFTVRYSPDEDRHLDMHIDECDVTFNFGLSDADSFQGSGLVFCGMYASSEYRKHTHTYTHQKGRCVLHSGKRRHGALSVEGGERVSLIMWTRSPAFRRTAQYKRIWGDEAVMQPESGTPDQVCISYSYDSDFDKLSSTLGDDAANEPTRR